MLSTVPVTRLSMAITLWSRLSSKSTRCDPRNPAPPVTTEVGGTFPFAVFFAAPIPIITSLPVFHHGIVPSHFEGIQPYLAPVPSKTTGIVRKRILKSSHNDQLSMYSRSSRTQSRKSCTLLRPLTCHRHVSPGLTLRRR